MSTGENNIDLAYISDLTTQPQVFKNPNWKSPNRRHKPLKTLLSDEQKKLNAEAEAAIAAASASATATTADAVVDGDINKAEPTSAANAAAKAAMPVGTGKPLSQRVNYFTLTNPPSLKPTKKYCDITGLPTTYRSPRNRLYFYNIEVYGIVKNLSQGVDQQYLEMRGAHVVLR